MADVPKLRCPECGVPLISPHSRGRHDSDGNYVEHRDACRCRWCSWMWFDEADPVKCECGTMAKVQIDDDAAYAVEAKS